MAFRILSLDGGGVWAVVQVKALIKLYGADTTGHRCNERGFRHHLIEIHVPHVTIAFLSGGVVDAIDADVNNNRPVANHVGFHKFGDTQGCD